jgi:hypothetical protein
VKKANGDTALRDILTELGPAPAQLARKDNSNVDLLLLTRNYKRDSEFYRDMFLFLFCGSAAKMSSCAKSSCGIATTKKRYKHT